MKSVPRDHGLSTFGKPRDAKRRPLGQVFLSFPILIILSLSLSLVGWSLLILFALVVKSRHSKCRHHVILHLRVNYAGISRSIFKNKNAESMILFSLGIKIRTSRSPFLSSLGMPRDAK